MMKRICFVFLSLTISVASAMADTEQESFSKARALFEQKKFNEAIAIYDKIPVKSDRWLLAVEEKAWAYMRLDQYDKAIAEARTLTSPALNALTGTEPYLLKALIELKSCDYVAVFNTLKDFKSRKRSQIDAIQTLSKTGSNAVSGAVLDVWMQNPSDWKVLGANIGLMPQLFYKDVIMLRAADAKNKSAMTKRLKELAVVENNENFRILQKLNLIEVESVQRVHIATQFNAKQGEKIERGEHDLVFDDTDEVWLDEIGSYQATINRCQKKSGRTM